MKSKKTILERLRRRKQDRLARARERRTLFAKRIAVVLILLTALLALRCSCDSIDAPLPPLDTPPETPVASPSPSATPGSRSPKEKRRPPRGASLGVLGRPDFIPGRDALEAWFEEFRTQATARSRNAAACFPGIERGAVRWSADILGNDGRVTRNEFVALMGLPELTSLQKKCLEEALAAEPYALRDFKRESARVSLVLEF